MNISKRVVAGAAATAVALMGLPGMALAAPAQTDKEPTGVEKVKVADDDKVVVAIDPGHNAIEVAEHDEETGIRMVDYPNGVELTDMWEVSRAVSEKLNEAGIVPIVLRTEVDEDVSYRERVERAEKIDADMAISLHSTPGSNYSMIIAQNEGGYREGPDASGETKRVTFDNAEVAAESQKLSKIVADGRSEAEPTPVKVVNEHTFDGRAPLWGGNTPVLSLMSDEVPWLYSEYGTDTGGGAKGLTAEEKEAYVEGLTKGIVEAAKTIEKDKKADSDADSDNKGKGKDKSETKSSDKDKDKSETKSSDDKDKDKSSDKSADGKDKSKDAAKDKAETKGSGKASEAPKSAAKEVKEAPKTAAVPETDSEMTPVPTEPNTPAPAEPNAPDPIFESSTRIGGAEMSFKIDAPAPAAEAPVSPEAAVAPLAQIDALKGAPDTPFTWDGELVESLLQQALDALTKIAGSVSGEDLVRITEQTTAITQELARLSQPILEGAVK